MEMEVLVMRIPGMWEGRDLVMSGDDDTNELLRYDVFGVGYTCNALEGKEGYKIWFVFFYVVVFECWFI